MSSETDDSLEKEEPSYCCNSTISPKGKTRDIREKIGSQSCNLAKGYASTLCLYPLPNLPPQRKKETQVRGGSFTTIP